MPTSSLIVSRQSARYVLPSLNPRPFRSCRFFSLNPYLVTSLLHQCPKPEVTKSPVVDPLSIQQLTKCFSHNSFVFMTIHFDGGGCVYPLRTSPLFRRANPCAHALLRACGKQDAAFYRIVS